VREVFPRVLERARFTEARDQRLKPPRYLLREAVVRQLILGLGSAKVLELGYGRGDMLLTLAECGLHGVGFDPSAAARAHAQQRLDAAGVRAFVLTDAYPDADSFDALLFFEVIGYVDDPVDWFRRHRRILKQGGRIIFSFTNSRHQGIAEEATGQMRCFDKDEMQAILAEAGYRVDRIINYGFPLANLLRLVRAPAYVGKNHAGTTDSQRQRQVERSGFVLSRGWIRAGTALFNSCLMRPFVWLQRLFRNTSAGTGFVVVASPREN